MKLGIYPGSFDPLTKGHIDIIERSSKFLDKLVIAISDKGSNKNFLLKTNERKKIIETYLKSRNFKNCKISVTVFKGLLMNFASQQKATVIIRGLRAVSDFEYEFQMTGMNYKLNPSVETIFLMASDQNQLISSKLVKEISSLKGDISNFVPKNVEKILKKKFKH